MKVPDNVTSRRISCWRGVTWLHRGSRAGRRRHACVAQKHACRVPKRSSFRWNPATLAAPSAVPSDNEEAAGEDVWPPHPDARTSAGTNTTMTVNRTVIPITGNPSKDHRSLAVPPRHVNAANTRTTSPVQPGLGTHEAIIDQDPAAVWIRPVRPISEPVHRSSAHPGVTSVVPQVQ